MFFSDMENRYIEPPTERPTPEQVMPTPASFTTTRSSLPHTTARSSLLQELQKLWVEIGESDNERTKMTLELEKECLDIYNKKVEETRKYKAELQRLLAEDEAEIASLISALGEQISFSWKVGPLKHRISTLKPVLEDLRMKKDLRWKKFSETLTQIAEISSNIAGNDYPCTSGDLTQTKLDGLNKHLQNLHNEKAARLQKVNSYISVVHELSEIMSFDFSEALSNVHESLTGSSRSISDKTLARLTELVKSLKKEKHRRLPQLQGLVRTMHKLWELMETPVDERGRFGHLSSLISHGADDALEKGYLGLDVVQEAKDEVKRLNALKKNMKTEQHLPGQQLAEIVNQDPLGSCRNDRDLLQTAEPQLPGENSAEIVNPDPQGSCGNDLELAEVEEANSFIKQLQGLVRTMHELWELMKTPTEERIRFGHFSSLLSQAADNALEKGCRLDILREAEAEVERLNALNESKDQMKELAVSETATQHLPEERVLLPGEQLGSPDTQGSSSNDGDSDAVKAESFIQQVLLLLEGRKRDTVREASIVLYDHLSRLFQNCYTLPEMENELVATCPTYDRHAKLPGHCFKLLVERTGGDEGSGGAAYLRHSLECSRQRKESEERRILEEIAEQRRASQPERTSTEEKIRGRKGRN